MPANPDAIRSVLADAVSNTVPLPLSFHNTLNLSKPGHNAANKRAAQQEIEILAWFQAREGRAFTPCECFAAFPRWPITSIRRAITNLTKQGRLRKTDEKRTGVYGILNYCWQIVVQGELN